MPDMPPTNDLSAKAGWADIQASMRRDGDTFSADIPENWRQGRTAYGGLTAALMLAGVMKRFEDLPPLRSALINFVGPVTGSPTLYSNLQRQGRNVTSLSAEAKVGEKSVGRAEFLFGAARSSNITVDFPAPAAPPPKEVPLFTPPAMRDVVPGFFHNFDTRLIAGGHPMMGTDEGYIRTWSRHKHAASRAGIESLLCIGDVLPPAAMPLMKTFAPISSMSWIFNVLMDAPATEDGWWHIESKLTAARGGYSSQVMRIWNTDGKLIVEGLQSIAIFDG